MQEAEKALISGLQIEKKHLESALNENSTLKEQYREKNEFLQQKFEDLFRESEAIKREVVSIDERKKTVTPGSTVSELRSTSSLKRMNQWSRTTAPCLCKCNHLSKPPSGWRKIIAVSKIT